LACDKLQVTFTTFAGIVIDLLEITQNGRRNIIQNSIEVDAETKESTRKTERNWMEDIRKAMIERNLNEGHGEDRKQWSLGVGQSRQTF
jgi:hypothetical protein